MSRLLTLLDRFPGTRVAVVADLIADEFLYGQISRVSREAPVLILRHSETRIVPGGGGNAVYNLRALGALPVPFGCVGRDDAGNALIAAFRAAGITTRHIGRIRGGTTTRKTRILASLPHSNRQQVLRIDREASVPPREADIDAFARNIVPTCGGLLLSDYGVGSVPATIAAHPAIRAFVRRRPVTVDSRYDLLRFTRLTAATPNEGEVAAALGGQIGDDPEALSRAGRRLLSRLQSQAVIITRGNKGMSVFERGKKPAHIPIYGGEEITDVTGAGDTVIATFTLALCCGASFVEAAQIANYAGGIVVMKRGTATVSLDELRTAVRDDQGQGSKDRGP